MTGGARPREALAALVVLLAVSYALRVALALGGGQWFWADESRYVQALDAVHVIAAGDVAGGLRIVAGTADHLGFKLLALAPAAVQSGLGLGLAASAAMLALASTLNILLVYAIARRAGADAFEALGAALAMGCSNAMFYWSRHLMPYDSAMALGLVLVYVAMKPDARARDAVLCGVLGFATFATYNGYWSLAALGVALHALVALPDVRAAAKRVLGMAAGGLGSAAAVVLAARHLLGVDLLASWRGFANTVTQGDFDDGHVVVFGYLWETEGMLAVVWALAMVALPVAAALGRRVDARAWLWLGCALALLVGLVVASNVFAKFVAYGRLARQAVPFCSLLAGNVLFGPWRGMRRVRWHGPAAAGLIVAVAAVNFAAPLAIVFPAEFVARGRAVVAAREGAPVGLADDGTGRYRFVNAKFVWPMPEPVVLPPGASVLMDATHPLQFTPYLYEGFDRAQRAAYRGADLRMRLVMVE